MTAVRMKSARHQSSVYRECHETDPGAGIPEFEAAIRGYRGDPAAIWTDRTTIHLMCMALQGETRFSSGCIPHVKGAIRGCRDDPAAIWTDRATIHPI